MRKLFEKVDEGSGNAPHEPNKQKPVAYKDATSKLSFEEKACLSQMSDGAKRLARKKLIEQKSMIERMNSVDLLLLMDCTSSMKKYID